MSIIATNPEFLNCAGAHEDLREVRLDVTRSCAYLVSEEGWELELQCDNVIELHQLGTLIQEMVKGSDVLVYWRGAVGVPDVAHK